MLFTDYEDNMLLIDSMEKVKLKCITFDSKRDKVVKSYKEFIKLSEFTKSNQQNSFYVYVERPNNSNCVYFELWEKVDSICVFVGRIDNACVETIESKINTEYCGKDGHVKFINAKANNNEWVSLIDIEFLTVINELELARKMTAYRLEYIAKEQKKQEEERREKEEQKKREEKEEQDRINNLLDNAENDLILGKEVYNENFNGKTLLLYLFDRNNVKVPIKTKGWVNSTLKSFQKTENGISYRYDRYGNQSSTFAKYVNILIDEIKIKKGIDN